MFPDGEKLSRLITVITDLNAFLYLLTAGVEA